MSDVPKPGYTMVPNAVFSMLSELGFAELKVILAIIRKTAGWQKEWDRLSVTQLEELTGLGRPSVVEGLEAAIKRGLVERRPISNSYEYKTVNLLNQLTNLNGEVSEPLSVKQVNRSEPKMVKLLNTQKKDSKEKKERERDAPTLDFLHEGVTTWKQLTGRRNITPVNANLIANAVTDTDRWAEVVKAWIGRGFKPENITGMLDWYTHPEKMKPATNGRQPPEERPPLPVFKPDPNKPSFAETAKRYREANNDRSS